MAARRAPASAIKGQGGSASDILMISVKTNIEGSQ